MGLIAMAAEFTFRQRTKNQIMALLCMGCYPGGSTQKLEDFKRYITGKRIKCKMDHATHDCVVGDEKRARDVFTYCYYHYTDDHLQDETELLQQNCSANDCPYNKHMKSNLKGASGGYIYVLSNVDDGRGN